jgi:protein involved in sex pheromone biosynthesis
MKLPLILLAAAPALMLAACSPRADDSVANSFDRTEKAIQNTAQTLESETENATRAASAALEAQANEFANRAEAVENAATSNSAERR